LHGARDIEHHDEPDELRTVIEERNRLRTTVVPDLEITLSERRDDSVVTVRHHDEGTYRVARDPEHRWLLRGTDGDRSACDKNRAGESSV
jgi:hypothetical protein